jgi:hypothetical protein
MQTSQSILMSNGSFDSFDSLGSLIARVSSSPVLGAYAALRMIALVGTPSPDVTRHVWAPSTWHVEVPRSWRTPSVIKLNPWT